MSNIVFQGTVLTAAPTVLDVSGEGDVATFQIDVTGAGTLEIVTKIGAQVAGNIQEAALTGATIKLDLVNVTEITLTASGADVPCNVSSHRAVQA
jgi:hypothetical protein